MSFKINGGGLMSMGKILTVKEACSLLKVSRPTLYKLIDENKIVAKKVGRQWRILEKSIYDLIEEENKMIERLFLNNNF